MRIAVLVEGRTEKAFKPVLHSFLKTRIAGSMPKLDIVPYDGLIPTGSKLKGIVRRLLHAQVRSAQAVIALTDLYTGTHPPRFATAEDAKQKLQSWANAEGKFFAHVAAHDFEAWLLPYWKKIQILTGSNLAAPAVHPESVNHNQPPSRWLADIYRQGSRTKSYVKTRDAGRILKDEDLLVAINACPELKAFVNRILQLANGELIT